MGNPTFRVEREYYVEPGGQRSAASCHHLKRQRGPRLRACGGCYRRLIDILERVRAGAPLEMIDDLFATMQSERE